jgi:hypothetical protein
MRLEEKIKQAREEFIFWVKREISLTLIFWLAAVALLLFRSFLLK